MSREHFRHSAAVIKTARWRSLRALVLRRDQYRCVKCSARGRLEVDHIFSVRTHPHLAFEMTNLQTLCVRCHASKTRAELGFPEVSPERKAWREAVKALMRI